MTKTISTSEKIKLLRKFLLFFLPAYPADFLKDSLLKVSKFIRTKIKKKNKSFWIILICLHQIFPSRSTKIICYDMPITKNKLNMRGKLRRFIRGKGRGCQVNLIWYCLEYENTIENADMRKGGWGVKNLKNLADMISERSHTSFKIYRPLVDRNTLPLPTKWQCRC